MISGTTPVPCAAIKFESVWMSCGVSFRALAVVAGCAIGQSSARVGPALPMRRPATIAALLSRRAPSPAERSSLAQAALGLMANSFHEGHSAPVWHIRQARPQLASLTTSRRVHSNEELQEEF